LSNDCYQIIYHIIYYKLEENEKKSIEAGESVVYERQQNHWFIHYRDKENMYQKKEITEEKDINFLNLFKSEKTKIISVSSDKDKKKLEEIATLFGSNTLRNLDINNPLPHPIEPKFKPQQLSELARGLEEMQGDLRRMLFDQEADGENKKELVYRALLTELDQSNKSTQPKSKKISQGTSDLREDLTFNKNDQKIPSTILNDDDRIRPN